jgi:cysteine-rich repeat protein
MWTRMRRGWLALLLGLMVAGPARAVPDNVPFDSNANGTLDSVVVDGDYDGDGHAEPEDIQAAIHALAGRLPGEPGNVLVRAHTYRELCRGAGDPLGYCAGDPHLACDPAQGEAACAAAGLAGSAAECVPIQCLDWDVRPYAGTGLPRPDKSALIELDTDDAHLSLTCEPGARIEGIWVKRRFDGSSPAATPGGLGQKGARLLGIAETEQIGVSGCDLDGGTPRGIGAYDPVAADWPLAAEGGTHDLLIDVDAGWRDYEWNRWWLLLRPGCAAPRSPYAWCSAAEELRQIVLTSDTLDAIAVGGFASPPLAGDRYLITYHSGGVCTGDRSQTCLLDGHCSLVGGPCDLSVQDDPQHGSRQTVFLSLASDVTFQGIRVSGSSHAGFYAKNSRRIELLDSELVENGGYYGRGHQTGWPSLYLFSGVPDAGCFGGTDCRLLDARLENNEIHRGGTAVNLRWAPAPGRNMYVENLVVRNNHVHDLFNADGEPFPGIMCMGRNALCEGNLIERAGGGVRVLGDVARGWPSERPLMGNLLNSWGVTVRNNVIRKLWKPRGSQLAVAHGLELVAGNEDVLFEGNEVEDAGQGPGAPVWGYGLITSGPNRRVASVANRVTGASRSSQYLTNSLGSPPEPGAWEEWVDLEADAPDLGTDAASHVGAPAGFADPAAIERLDLGFGGRVVLRDVRDAGNRGGVGGASEALYVDTLVLEDAASLLNLNGLHLYVNTLIGNPAQIIDVGAECGDGLPDPGEICDDGNATPGDGCSATCRPEESVSLFGLAEGGSVEIVVEGVAISFATSPQQNSVDVIEELADRINADPVLQGLQTTAVALVNRLAVGGSIDAFQVDDPGLLQSLPGLPALGRGGVFALAMLLLSAAALGLVRGPRARGA